MYLIINRLVIRILPARPAKTNFVLHPLAVVYSSVFGFAMFTVPRIMGDCLADFKALLHHSIMSTNCDIILTYNTEVAVNY
jgi:hypothetical protein